MANARLSHWAGLADSLRRVRTAHGLRLEDIGAASAPHLSRIERNQGPPTEAIVRAYEVATGEPGLVAMYHRLASQDGSDAAATSAKPRKRPYYEDQWNLVEFDSHVEMGSPVRVMEHRTIKSVVAGLGQIQIRQTLFETNGVTPQLLKISAVRTGIDEVEWTSKNAFTIKMTLPSELKAGQTHRFTLSYELDFLYPRYTFQPLVHAERFRLTLQLPDPAYRVLEFDGQSMTVANDFAKSAEVGGPHDLTDTPLDAFNSVEVEYARISPGLIYGLMWLPLEGRS